MERQTTINTDIYTQEFPVSLMWTCVWTKRGSNRREPTLTQRQHTNSKVRREQTEREMWLWLPPAGGSAAILASFFCEPPHSPTLPSPSCHQACMTCCTCARLSLSLKGRGSSTTDSERFMEPHALGQRASKLHHHKRIVNCVRWLRWMLLLYG